MDGENATILIVEDDAEMRQYLSRLLRARGYPSVEAGDGVEALELLKRMSPHVVLLDMMMPHMDGIETCHQIRARYTCPIIVISALHDEQRKVLALEAGADDYLTKPFGPDELIARIRAALRRTHYPRVDDEALHFGGIKVDLQQNCVYRDGELLRLTKTELSLVCALAERVGRVVDQRTLLQSVWGPEYGGESEYLHVYIGRLRRKLEEDPTKPRFLLTEPGIGYRLIAKTTAIDPQLSVYARKGL